MATISTSPDLAAPVAWFHDYESLGWFPTDLGGQFVVPAGVWFDIVVMPSTLAGNVLDELSIALMPAAAIHDHTQDRTGVLTAPTNTRPALPRDLILAQVCLVSPGMPVPLPGPSSRRYSWLSRPDTVPHSPPWSVVVGAARRVLSGRSWGGRNDH